MNEEKCRKDERGVSSYILCLIVCPKMTAKHAGAPDLR